MYYLCSKNKGADQLRGYRKADLRLCFRICEKPVFSQRGSIIKILGSHRMSQAPQLSMKFILPISVLKVPTFYPAHKCLNANNY